MEQVENWNEDFMDGTFNGSAKGGRIKEELCYLNYSLVT